MATSKVDGTSNGSVKSKDEEGTTPSIFEIDDSDLTRLLEKPRPLNTERKRSFDERSFSEMSITMSPRNNFYRTSEHSSRAFDNLDGVYSPGRWTGTPRSACFEPHPIVGEAWEALRRSIVNFRGQTRWDYCRT
ncbi:putative beta-fructofuranosidase [Helianthus annuus]|nr:putative beta-fructofuranosidase [Helianthus annuus]